MGEPKGETSETQMLCKRILRSTKEIPQQALIDGIPTFSSDCLFLGSSVRPLLGIIRCQNSFSTRTSFRRARQESQRVRLRSKGSPASVLCTSRQFLAALARDTRQRYLHRRLDDRPLHSRTTESHLWPSRWSGYVSAGTSALRIIQVSTR